MRLCLLIALAGCDFSAATSVVGADTAADTGLGTADGSDGGGGSDGADGTTEPVDPATTDDDGDGLSEVEGDCDDADPTVRPGELDDCDGRDDDCDGAVDEDAWLDDPHEPNDEVAWPGGSWHDTPARSLEGTLHDDADVDRYRFSMEDSGWSLFSIEVGLSGVPDGARYGLALSNVTTGAAYGSDEGGGALSLTADDQIFIDETGTWEVTVWSLGGADCARPYLLSVAFSD